MREIIQIQVGKCGNQIGTDFWDKIIKEHNIDENGMPTTSSSEETHVEYKDVYFSESATGRYVPRALLVDMEPGTIDSIRSGHLGSLFHHDNYFSGKHSAANNWAKGHYTDGSEMIEAIMDVVRKEVEKCDAMQGFQFVHSIGGGTGGGLGALIQDKYRAEYVDKMLTTFTIFPSPSLSSSTVEPYNAILSMHRLIDYPDIIVSLENDALFRLHSQATKYNNCNNNEYNNNNNNNNIEDKTKSFRGMNWIVSHVMSDITAGFRFPGELNTNWRKLAVNLVPFPRLKFTIPSFAPLNYIFRHNSTTNNNNTNNIEDKTEDETEDKNKNVNIKEKREYEIITVDSIAQEMFAPQSQMITCDYMGRYYTGAAMFRGKASTYAVEQKMNAMIDKNSSYFTEWIPDNIQTSLCSSPSSLSLPLSATFLGNSTTVAQCHKRMADSFTTLFRRKAFLHWFTSEGMDEMEFTEAESNVHDVICEMTVVCDGCNCGDEEFDDEEGEEQ